MGDDLLKRLRDNGHSLTQRERSQAAARIEALERELAAARQIERNVQAAREAEHQRAEKALRELAEANADAERLAKAASAERHFGQLIADEIEIEPEETTFVFCVMPEGRPVAVRSWAEVAAETEAALAAHGARKEGNG